MKKHITVIFIALNLTILTFISSCSPAQPADSSYTRILELLAESNSKLERFELDNGMICLLKEDHSAPVASVQVWVGVGSNMEDDYLGAGISHAVEHMLFKGTKKRQTGEYWKEIEEAGGQANAYTSNNRTVYYTDIPASDWKTGFDVIADAVMNATFPEEEWKKEKNVILREFAMGKDNPNRVIHKLLSRTAYRVHPDRYPTIGYEDIFKKNTREDLVKHYRRHYVPDNMITVVVGDIDIADAKKTIKETFSNFERRRRRPVIIPEEPGQIAPRFARTTGPYKITRSAISYHTVPISHPDAVALDVLAEIIGHGQSCRLVKNIREKKKLVTGISAGSYNSSQTGMFLISAEFEPENETKVLAAIEEEIQSWSTTTFSTEEVAKSGRKALVYELSELETIKGQAASYAGGEFFAGNPRIGETYIRRLQKITPDELKRVAGKYFHAANRTTVLLSPDREPAKKPQAKAKAPTDENIVRKVLPNGIPVLVKSDRSLPFVYISVVLNGGLLSETPEINGITSMMASLLKRGTASRTYNDIAEQTESLGAYISTFSGNNTFGITARCLSSDTEKVLDIISDCLLKSSFPQEEIDRQKEYQLAAIDRNFEKPIFLASHQFKKAVFNGHPYSMPKDGTRESVKAITREAITAHYKKLVLSGNMVVSMFGDINTEQALILGRKYLGSTPEGPRPQFNLEPSSPDLPREISIENDQEQAILIVGFPGVTIKDPESDALSLLSSALGGLGSNLGVEVREKRGLVYYIAARHNPAVDPGSFFIYAGTRRDAVGKLKELIAKELKRISTKGLSSTELEREKKKIIANYEMESQNSGSMATSCAINELLGLGYDYEINTRSRFESLSIEDVRKTAEEILSPDKKVTSIVLPEQIEDGN